MSLLSHLRNLTQAFASLGKVVLLSRPAFGRGRQAAGRPLVILGNGPSLRQAIDISLPSILKSARLALNFAANAPEFLSLSPQYYVLADGHFFSEEGTDPNVDRLWQNIETVAWPMTLFVPVRYCSCVRERLSQNVHIRVQPFNLTPAEGSVWLTHPLFDAGLAMPRPRNVLIPSIMIGIRLGFKQIYLCGADHTWTRTLDVDNQNHVISVQPHFYKDSAGEQKRVNTEYAGLHLHDILRSLYIAFNSYHEIACYAVSRHVEIFNATPGSMIDAFPRRELPPSAP